MGFFRSRNKRRRNKRGFSFKRVNQESQDGTSLEPSPEPLPSSLSFSKSKRNLVTTPTTTSSSIRSTNSQSSKSPLSGSIETLPGLLRCLAIAKETSGEKPARALRKLFALSEHDAFDENRTRMVQVENGQLVPTLFNFLRRCSPGSSEQYLALLVLNNISIPADNKRLIALDFGGARLLGRLLCDDPSRHLIAIIMVNLTFVDADLRSELITTGGVQLMESLSFALRVASLTQEEYNVRAAVVKNRRGYAKRPADRLVQLLAVDMRVGFSSMPSPSQQLFPETARWCLAAMKHLTRPSTDTSAVRALIRCGIVPHVLRFITVPVRVVGTSANDVDSSASDPSTWDSSSAQDAALFIVLNLTTVCSAREYMRGVDTLEILPMISVCQNRGDSEKDSEDEQKIAAFQCLKAKMALAFMIGAEGNFGQPKARTSPSVYINADDTLLLLNEREATQFVDLLANSLHHRQKDGPGGYSAATFSVKCVLAAMRYLLSNDWNQILFANVAGPRLNALLMKALAQHAIEKVGYIDEEAAEHVVFSLYLLSHYGFEDCFLPSSFLNKKVNPRRLAAKVWTAYLRTETITSPGKHAAGQLLLRLKYLLFQGTAETMIDDDINKSSVLASDLVFSDELFAAAKGIVVDKITPGAKPQEDIFLRPVLRCRPPTKGSQRLPWDNYAAIDSFPSALVAVHELSFASSKVRHDSGAIDDIAMANNIANSANGEKTESYSYLWSWQDNAAEINKNLERGSSGDSFGSSIDTFAGLRLGNLCACNTTA